MIPRDQPSPDEAAITGAADPIIARLLGDIRKHPETIRAAVFLTVVSNVLGVVMAQNDVQIGEALLSTVVAGALRVERAERAVRGEPGLLTPPPKTIGRADDCRHQAPRPRRARFPKDTRS